MSQIYLEIRDADSLVSFLLETQKRTGLLKDISPVKLKEALRNKEFPIRVPVNMNGVLDVAANPILKKVFGKRVEEATRRYIKAALEIG